MRETVSENAILGPGTGPVPKARHVKARHRSAGAAWQKGIESPKGDGTQWRTLTQTSSFIAYSARRTDRTPYPTNCTKSSVCTSSGSAKATTSPCSVPEAPRITLICSLHCPASVPLAKAVQVLKANSSRWLGEHGFEFAWQEGYGAFSVSASNRDAVRHYIEHQAEHHAKHSFEDEFVSLLRKSRVEYDPQFVFG